MRLSSFSLPLLLVLLGLLLCAHLCFAQQPSVSPSWVQYCIRFENGFNRLSVAAPYPAVQNLVKYQGDGSTCLTGTTAGCVFITPIPSWTGLIAPCILGSFSYFEGSELV